LPHFLQVTENVINGKMWQQVHISKEADEYELTQLKIWGAPGPAY